MLQNSPGQIGFESAPFKLTQEYVDLMEGIDSDKFELFKSLFNAGLIEVSQHLSDLESIITVMAKDSHMPCVKRPNSVMSELKDRIKPGSVERNSFFGNIETEPTNQNSGQKPARNEYFEFTEKLVK